MKNFSIKAAYKRGWEILRANEKKLIAITFILLVAGALQNVVIRGTRGYGLAALILIIAYYIVTTILKIGVTKTFLKLEDGEPIALRELFSYSNLFLRFLVASLLYMLLVGVGFILLVIPGIYFLIKYMFVPVIVIDDYVPIRKAFKMSAEMTKGHKWQLLWFMILMVLSNIAGAILFLIGLFVSLPVSMSAFIHIYRKLEKPESQAL